MAADLLLAPRPKYSEYFAAWCYDLAQLPPVIDALRERRTRLHVTVRSAHRVWSESGDVWPVRTSSAGYPVRISFTYWADDLDELRWQRNHAERVTRAAPDSRSVTSSWSKIEDRAATRMPASVHALYLKGLAFDAPHQESIEGMYRVQGRAARAAPLDLDRDGIGLFWATPVVPMRGDDVLALLHEAEATAIRNGVEPDISMVTVDDWRYFDAIVGFAFDAQQPAQLKAAERAFATFTKKMTKRGYPTYRTGIQHAVEGVQSKARQRVLRELKQHFDPAGILSPWRTGARVNE